MRLRHPWATTILFTCMFFASGACELASGLNKLHTPAPESSPDAGASLTQEIPASPSDPARNNVANEAPQTNARSAISGQGGNTNGSAPEAGSAGMHMGMPPSAADTSVRGGELADASVGMTPRNETGTMSTNAESPPTAADGAVAGHGSMSDAPASGTNGGGDNMSEPESMGAPASMMHASEVIDAGAAMTPEASDPSMSGANAAGSGAPPADPQCTPSFPGASCDTAPQCGCAEGDNCAYLSLGFPTCVRAGSARLNQPCLLATDCQSGLQCLDGACLQLCDPTQSSCENAGACGQIYQAGRAIQGYYTCSSDCNLAAPQDQSDDLAACGSGLSCVWYGDGGTACARPHQSQAKHGERCEDAFDCGPGYACLTGGTCGKWCRDARDCPSGFFCEETSVSVRDTRFGLCRPDCPGPRDQSCQVLPQCGCEGTMACDYLSRSDDQYAPACRARGSVPAHYNCESTLDCAAGTSCIGGRCSLFCYNDTDCGDVYAKCEQVTNGLLSSSPPIPDYLTCRFPCDPANLTRPRGSYDACPAGFPGCAPATDGRSYCHNVNSQAAWGDSCSTSADCAVGDLCTGSGCAPLCRTDSDCPSGSACYEFSPRLFAGSQPWGVCFSVSADGT